MPLTDPSPLQTLIPRLLSAHRIVVFTGAGMSAESGIQTFRGASDGYWSQFNPETLASPAGWRANRQRVWAWYEGRRATALQAQPHTGHYAVAQIAQTLRTAHGREVQLDVITQNVDNLHDRAGSSSVIHLHGSLFAPRCIACELPGEFAIEPPSQAITELEPPNCNHCGASLRPGVVWFGEAMPQAPWRLAEDLVDTCDVMLVIGTSGVVFPAAELPIAASRLGKFVAEINPQRSELSKYMSLHWSSTAAQGMPLVVEALARRA